MLSCIVNYTVTVHVLQGIPARASDLHNPQPSRHSTPANPSTPSTEEPPQQPPAPPSSKSPIYLFILTSL